MEIILSSLGTKQRIIVIALDFPVAQFSLNQPFEMMSTSHCLAHCMGWIRRMSLLRTVISSVCKCWSGRSCQQKFNHSWAMDYACNRPTHGCQDSFAAHH